MSDPVPAITEAAATGEIAAIFCRYPPGAGCRCRQPDLARRAALGLAGLRPLYVDGSVIRRVTALRRDLALPPMPPIQAEVYPALGLRPEDMAAIRGILSAHDHTNGMAVVALTALRGRLDGRVPAGVKPAEPTPLAAAPRIGLPKLLDVTVMPPETAALVTALNGFGTRHPGAVLASMYRHLAHWPSYLAFAWLLLAPIDGDGRLAAAIDQAQRAAQSHADALLVRLMDHAAPPPSAPAAWISAAVEPFVDDVIVKMLVICAFLRRVTA